MSRFCTTMPLPKKLNGSVEITKAAVETPVDVERIVDLDLQVDIAPHPGRRNLEIESFLSEDMRTIWVSQYVCDNVEVRYRFSLAHELGHIVLHKRIFESFSFSDVVEWKDLCLSIHPNDYSILEAQANNFAGLLLVPRSCLETEFKRALSSVAYMIERATSKGAARDQYLDYALGAVADELKPIFNVSGQTLKIRMAKDRLHELIE